MAYNWEDYYTNKYSNKNRKTYYDDYEDGGYYKGGGYNSNWSWGTFGGSLFQEDDDKELHVKSHESYFTPKAEDFEKRLKYSSNTKANRDLIKEMSRFFYYRMLDESDYFDEKYKDPSRLTETELSKFEEKKAYYNELWDKEIPGVSPLEKSLFIFSKIEEKGGEGKKNYEAQLIQEAIEGIKVDMEAYADPIYNELLDINEFSKKQKFKILDKISMIKNLGSEFKIQKETEEKIVANSSIVVKKLMRDYSQIHSIELYQKLMPDFPIKLLTKNLIVNAPVDRTDHKQKIIFLVDYSG